MGTTIETTNVVTRFVTEYDSASARRAANEAQRIGDRIDGSFDKAATEAKQSFNKIERESKSSLSKVERNFKGTENRLTTLFKGLGTKLAAIGIGAILGQTINKAIQAAANFETLSQSFKILTGDVATANALIKELNDFSLVTPFKPDEINNAARTLLGFGRSANIVLDDLKLIGNAAAATGSDLQSLALVFGQVAGAGKLQGQDALQFINAGIPIYQILEESLGKSTAELKKLQEQGKITFADLRKAFAEASEEGGKFFNALEQQSKTFNGLKSTLQGFIGEALRGIGNIFLPAAKSFLQSLIGVTSGFVNFLSNNTEAIRDFLGRIRTSFAAAFRPLTTALRGFFSSISTGVNPLSTFERILTGVARQIAFISNLAGTVIGVFTSVINGIRELTSAGENQSKVFVSLGQIFEELPKVYNGILEVGKTFFDRLRLQYELGFEKIKRSFLAVQKFFTLDEKERSKLTELIKLSDFEIENREVKLGFRTLTRAYEIGYKEIDDIEVNFDNLKKNTVEEIKDLTGTVTSEITTGLDDAAAKAKKKLDSFSLGDVAATDNDLNNLEGSIQREIIEEQIRLNDFLAANVTLTEEQKAKAVNDSTEIQIRAQIRLLQVRRALLELNGGNEKELLDVSLAISELNKQLAELGTGVVSLDNSKKALTGFDSLLQTLFPKGDIEGIKSELSNLYSELLNLANGYIQQREQILNNEVQAAEDRVNSILNLSENASQQQLDFEKNRLEQSQKARDAFSKKQQAAAKIEAAANIVAALARIAAETGVTSFATLPAFIALFSGLAAAAVQIFHEGTESVGDGKGSRVSDKGLKQNEVLAILEKDERVIDKKLNKQLAGMSNKDLVKNALIGKNIQRAGIAPGVINLFTQNAAQSSELREIRKALQSVEATIKGLKIEANQNIDGDGVHQLVSMEMKKKVNQIKRIR